MAIAFGGATQQVNSGSTTNNLVLSPSGSDLIGFSFTVDDALGTTTVTWNGVSMTEIANVTDTSGFFKLTLFYIVNPGGSAVNATRTSGTGDFYHHAAWYSGAGQTGQPDSFATTALTAGTSLTQTTTVVNANSWLFCGALADGGGLAASTGSTLRGSVLNTAVGIFDSNGTVGTGAQSLVQSMNNGLRTGIIASFRPPAAAVSGSRLMMMGVGT